jgi:NitT/TauT family transport system ATP-binding protein
MINEPALMILDEPFRGLDAMAKQLMLEYYSNLCESSKRTNFFVTTDVAEAIFLADRLLVMTQIPTRVRAVIDVDIPRPRSLESVAASDHASELKHRVLSLLHEEIAKSFGAGSKSGASFIAANRCRLA